jgi:uncharacterized protein YgiM (DUF1202 family)
MQKSANEVIMIRKITVWIGLVLLAGVLILPAKAADMDSKAGTVTVSSGRLNVRSNASSAAAIVATLNKGEYVTLLAKSSDWWKVEYEEGKYGYCHAGYIQQLNGTPATVNTASGRLNIRSGPGTGYAKIGSIGKGETVIVLSQAGGWSRILYGGTQTGYVSSDYLAQNYATVSLWVRDMKQMDSRWAQTIIGESGKTMSQIGCATTAIAMLEAHRTGKTVYPDVMTTMLKYTPSGSVYWPEHYTAVTDNTNYLSAVYRRLQQGKPILFGATNRYGSQHWVIITGFTGGNHLTADRFTIRDPGSYSRTNLQQFLAEYPNFYKYFYY